jgi:hypothetical protein
MDISQPDWWNTSGRIWIKLVLVLLLAIWCVAAVDWRRLWPVLAAGGWAPLVLIGIMVGAVALMIWPKSIELTPGWMIPIGMWQFGGAGLLVCLVLFCGWVQTRIGYAPPVIDLDEPSHAAGGHDDHGHH